MDVLKDINDPQSWSNHNTESPVKLASLSMKGGFLESTIEHAGNSFIVYHDTHGASIKDQQGNKVNSFTTELPQPVRALFDAVNADGINVSQTICHTNLGSEQEKIQQLFGISDVPYVPLVESVLPPKKEERAVTPSSDTPTAVISEPSAHEKTIKPEVLTFPHSEKYQNNDRFNPGKYKDVKTKDDIITALENFDKEGFQDKKVDFTERGRGSLGADFVFRDEKDLFSAFVEVTMGKEDGLAHHNQSSPVKILEIGKRSIEPPYAYLEFEGGKYMMKFEQQGHSLLHVTHPNGEEITSPSIGSITRQVDVMATAPEKGIEIMQAILTSGIDTQHTRLEKSFGRSECELAGVIAAQVFGVNERHKGVNQLKEGGMSR
jgi:hypothetical protein